MSQNSKDSENPDTKGDLLSLKRSAFWHLWKRRALLILALILVLIPLLGTFEPLFEFILFAISLAALTYPVFYRPINRLMKRFFPKFSRNRLSEFSAILSTLTLVLFMLSPILLLLVEATRSTQGFENGCISRIRRRGGNSLESVEQRVSRCDRFIPDYWMKLKLWNLRFWETRDNFGSFLEFFKGTRGFVAELTLAS